MGEKKNETQNELLIASNKSMNETNFLMTVEFGIQPI